MKANISSKRTWSGYAASLCLFRTENKYATFKIRNYRMFSRKSEMDGHRRLTVRRSEFPNYGGRQPRESLTADGYRLSIAGGQSTVKRPKTHSSNDPRDLTKKPFVYIVLKFY